MTRIYFFKSNGLTKKDQVKMTKVGTNMLSDTAKRRQKDGNETATSDKVIIRTSLGHFLRYVAMIFAVLVMSMANVGMAWGDTELVNINISSWSTQSVSAGGSVSGCYFKSAATITNGSGWVKTGNASKTQHYIGIPLSNINGSVTITVSHKSSRPTMGYELVTGNSAYNGDYSHSNSMSTTRIGSNGTTTTITINNLSGSYGHLILGATGNASNNDFYISNIVVTTPASSCASNPANPTGLSVENITQGGATFTITDGANTNNYEIVCKTTSGSPAADATPTQTGTSKTIVVATGLTESTTYYAFVRSVCDGSHKSSWVALGSSTFTTKSCSISSCGNATLTYVINVGSSGSHASGGTDLISSATASNTTALGISTTPTYQTITMSDLNKKAAAAVSTCYPTKPNMTGKIGVYNGASYSSTNYLQFSFTVKSGYTFTPCDIRLVVQPVDVATSFRWEVTDGTNSYGYGTATDVPKGSDGGASVLTGLSSTAEMAAGTYYIRLYPYTSAASKTFRLGTDVVLKGTTAAASSCSDDTGLAYGETTVNKTYGDAEFTNTLTNSNSLSVTYSSTNTNVATVNGSTGAVTIKAAGTTTIKATWAGNATYCEDEVSYTLNVKPAVGEVSGDWDRFGGETISLSVTPSGGSSYTYQWRKWYNDQWNNIAGATGATYTKNNCDKDDSGSYSCAVTSAGQTNETAGFQVKVFVLECYNNGTTVYNFTRDGNNQRGSVNIDLAASTAYGYKVHVDNDYYGNNGTVDEDITNWVLCNNNNEYCNPNLTVNAGLGGTFTFTMDYSASGASSVVGEPELSITYPRKRIYLSPGVWDADGAKFAYYYFRDGGSTAWTDFLTEDDCGNYADIPQWNGVKVIAGRINGELDTPAFGDGKCWNQTNNITVGSYDYITITGWNASDYTYNSTYSTPTYTISYAKGSPSASISGSKSDETKTCGVNFTLPSSAVFTREGYLQTGWTTSDGGAQTHALGGSYTTNDDQPFYPVWTVQSYNLTWDLAGGTTTSAGTGIASGVSVNTTTSQNYGVSLTAPTVTKANYDFSAWSPAVASTMPAAATTYTATWTAKKYNVSTSLTNVTVSSGTTGSNAATYGTNYMLTLAADDGFVLPGSITVTIGGDAAPGGSYTYNSSTGDVTITGSYITGAIVITVTGAYAANFQMIADASAENAATVSHNESLAQGSKNCSMLTGGTAKYVALDASTSMTVNKNNSNSQYGWYIQSQQSIVITLSSHMLQAGSVIYVQGNAASNNGITINGSTVLKNNTGAQGTYTDSYTVVAGDTHLVGKNVITITRNGDSRLQEIAFSNCQSGTPCITPVLPSLTTPNQGCTTGDFAAWNATVTNAAAISAASGSQSVSYSWKNSSSVEVATTASYTPTAAGTYTVTATVHSDASGYIDATATSSTLTASLYGNPTVTGPSDAEYVVDESASNLSVTATPTHGESLTYQWYSNTAKSTSSPTPTALANCTTSTYKPSTAAAATTYYFCKVSGGCEDVYSSIATVTVTAGPCFTMTANTSAKSNGSLDHNESISVGSDNCSALTGGTAKYVNSTGSGTMEVTKNKGWYFNSNNDQIVVSLSEGSFLQSGSVITVAGNAEGSNRGFKVNGVTVFTATGSGNFSGETYTVTGSDTELLNKRVLTITRSSGNGLRLSSISISDCGSCTPIDPELSYSKTTIWMDDADLTATPTLTGNTGSGAVTYSSSNTDAVTVVESGEGAGTITAVGRGTATITASIAKNAGYCNAEATCEITVKDINCDELSIASATRQSGSSNTMENGKGVAYSAAGYSGQTDGKLGSNGNYMYITLTGTYLRDGDVVVINIAKKNDGGIYLYKGTTSAGTAIGSIDASSVKAGDNEITLSGVPENTSSVTMCRVDENQNHRVDGIAVKRYVCPDSKEFLPTGDDGNWNATANWIGATGRGASLPTIDDRVIISKPVTVDIADAKAKDVLVNQYSGATGKITISAGKELVVAGTLRKTTNGSSFGATGENDVFINSSPSAGLGALVMGSHDGTNKATINFYSKSHGTKNSSASVAQYLGVPFSDATVLSDLYNSWVYKINNEDVGNIYWQRVSGDETLRAFKGYCVFAADAEADPGHYYWMQGTMVATANQSLTLYWKSGTESNPNNETLLANSWMAPIKISAFEVEDFSGADATIYIFNAGSLQDWIKAGGDEEGHYNPDPAVGDDTPAPGQYSAYTIKSTKYTGDAVIPAMQSFSVFTNGTVSSMDGSRLALDFNRLVYTPAIDNHADPVPNRAPRRAVKEEDPELMRLFVNAESGYSDKLLMLGREDFEQGFENGWDGRKIFGETVAPQLYAITPDGNMAINCIPTFEGTVLGFKAGSEDNSYTFRFSYNGDEALYLNDLKEEKSTLINGENTYQFFTAAGDLEARFVISATPYGAPEIATGVENTAQGTDVRKVIINDKMYIIRGGRMYSADGQMVR